MASTYNATNIYVDLGQQKTLHFECFSIADAHNLET